MAKWHFNTKRPSDRVREPIVGEYFSVESISNPGEALVREGIQNSLDAAKGTEPVLVRVFLSGSEDALPPDRVAPFFEGAWEHFCASGNGLKAPPSPEEPCPYLVFEDNGTRGLGGNTRQTNPVDGVANDFYYFFRAEGRSLKSEGDRGRWGVGKHVFQRASRANTMFGYSLRAEDGNRVLMGQSVLRSHPVNSDYFMPDGWFGVTDSRGVVMPVEDDSELELFCDTFGITRGGAHGLSIIVPWYDPALDETSIVAGVVRGYFHPILAGRLEVVVQTPSVPETLLDRESFLDETARIESMLGEEAKGLRQLADLASWALSQPEESMHQLENPGASGALRWKPELVPADVASGMQAAVESGDRFAIRVPLTVREKGIDPKESHFDIFLTRDIADGSGCPVFIREGITIADVRAPRTRGICSIVVAEDGPIATLLGNAENPAHTEWQKTCSNFEGKYTYGPSYLKFVERSVHELNRIVSESGQTEDTTLLADMLSVPPLPDEERGGARTRKRDSRDEQEKEPPDGLDPPPPPRRPRAFGITQVTGGFSVCSSDEGASRPPALEIRAAYATRRGNPFSKYSPKDFDFASSRISITTQGVDVVARGENRLLVALHDDEFRVAITGFDERRDVRVQVIPKEAPGGR